MKDKMTGQKQKNKKGKMDQKRREKELKANKGKRKSDSAIDGAEVKRKRDKDTEMDVEDKHHDSDSGLKRPHDEADNVDEKCLREKLSEFGKIVSLRVRAGQAVEAALKHDRAPLNGRPMFLSRYSATKHSQSFKYSTEAENNKLFVKNLPYSHCTKEALTEIFDKYGALKDVRVVTFKDGKPKGLAYIEYEDEQSASQALEKSNGLMVGERKIDVAISAPPRKDGDKVALGQPKRDAGGGMRRTQLSSFIPSVLQKPSTSANGQTNGQEKRPLSNSDFRSLLLKN
ncbi:unnamed protein product [Leptidea sinapis]|uniref:RRM domain-containing protein n=1 Tax=Leptidea sinapis TaxID=189913 RepID=A0A5E4PU46_9NEOP|nr:unnamed protein product [Leptidea sinapis]